MSEEQIGLADIVAPAPPRYLCPDFDRMPPELKLLKNWVLWAPIWNGKKWTKRPIQVSGFGASTTTAKHWSAFEDVLRAYQRAVQRGYMETREKSPGAVQRHPIGGVGFVFDGRPDESGLVFAGVDFDKVISGGEIASLAQERIRRFRSYIERSVSGDGLHVIVKARALASGIAHDGVEMYTTGRYFTMTGRAPEKARIVTAPDAFAALANELQSQGAHRALRGADAPTSNITTLLKLPEWVINSRPLAVFGHLPVEGFSGGLEANIEEIRSAVLAIPSSAISTEPEWMRVARALAHEATVYKRQAEQLWEVLDTASRSAPGYNESDNRSRWLRYIDEALDRANPITIATIFDLARKHGWSGWSPPVATSPRVGLSTAAIPGQIVWSPASLNVSLSMLPHRRWLYGTYLIRGEITVVAAPGGVGKTALATGIAVEIATGVEILEETIWGGKDLKVLFINAEDGLTEIERRVRAFYLAHASNLSGQKLDRLYVAAAGDARVQRMSFLSTTEKGLSVLDRTGFAVLVSALHSLRPDVLVLDPLVAFCGGGNMNDNALMSLVIRELKRLAAEFDCAVLIVHHTRKGADVGDAEGISGAAAIVNLARRAIMPVPMSEKEAEKFDVLPSERFRYFKLVDAKSNLAPRSAKSPWYELHSVELNNPEPPVYPSGDNVQAITRRNFALLNSVSAAVDEQKIRRAILDLVDRGKIIDGEAYPYSPTLAGAKNERALLDDAMAEAASSTAPRQWDPADLKAVTSRAIDKMRTEEWLSVESMESLMSDPGRFRRRRGLRVDRSRTPWPNAASDGSSSASDDPAREEDLPVEG
jgi:RecA/RadA recombinase